MSEERRLYPRADAQIPVELINCIGAQAQGMVINLSEGGLLVAGDASLAKVYALQMGVPLELSLCFSLAGETVRCDARAVYQRRLSQQQYELGLEFSWLDPASLRLVQAEVVSAC